MLSSVRGEVSLDYRLSAERRTCSFFLFRREAPTVGEIYVWRQYDIHGRPTREVISPFFLAKAERLD